MKCLDEGTLQAYLDSELPEARMRRAAGHLEACAPCRDRLGRIEAAVVRVNAWLDALAPAGLPALDDAVPRIAAKTSGLRWRWAAVALAGALAASVALFFANSRPHPEPARAAKREAGMHKPRWPWRARWRRPSRCSSPTAGPTPNRHAPQRERQACTSRKHRQWYTEPDPEGTPSGSGFQCTGRRRSPHWTISFRSMMPIRCRWAWWSG